ncbi:DUF1499 domain-containing protein [Brevundimonas sp.]
MGYVRLAAGLAVAGPLLTFIAVLLTRNGIVPLDVGLDVLTLKVGQVLAWFALGFAVITLALSLRDFRRVGLVSVAILAVSGAVAATFFVQARAISVAGPLDVSTDLAEVPGIVGVSGTPVACPGVVAVTRQVAPEEATAALQGAGFSITESQLFRSRGVRDGFWFGMGHEAHIRIRPGRTDVRVAARYDHTDGGQTCRVLKAVVDGLQAGT